MEKLPELVLEVYARFIGLELADVAVDGCINKDPCGSESYRHGPSQAAQR